VKKHEKGPYKLPCTLLRVEIALISQGHETRVFVGSSAPVVFKATWVAEWGRAKVPFVTRAVAVCLMSVLHKCLIVSSPVVRRV